MNRRSPDYVESTSSIRLRGVLFGCVCLAVLGLSAWLSVTDSSPWSPALTIAALGIGAYPVGVAIFYAAPTWGSQLRSGLVVSAFSAFLAWQMIDLLDPRTVRASVGFLALYAVGLVLVGLWAWRAERSAESREDGL